MTRTNLEATGTASGVMFFDLYSAFNTVRLALLRQVGKGKSGRKTGFMDIILSQQQATVHEATELFKVVVSSTGLYNKLD